MFRKYFTLFIMLSSIITVSVLATDEDGILEGRFTGVLRHTQQPKNMRDQLTKLDFILTRKQADETFNLTALLTVYFGGFDSGEYLTYVFDDVEMNLIKGQLTFKKNAQDLTVFTERFSEHEFVGRLQSTAGNVQSTLILRRDGKVPLKYPLVEPVWGEYRGSCKGLHTNLQLYSVRSQAEVAHQGNLFAPYEIKGTMARNAELCPLKNNPFGAPCVKNYVTGGSYNFFRNRLSLSGNLGALECETFPGLLVCNGCKLKRHSKELQSPKLKIPEVSSAFPDDSEGALDAPEALSGTYKGFVQHELSNQFQRASMTLSARQTGAGGPGGGLKIALESKLHFGDCDHPVETLVFSFEEQNYGDPLLGPQFLFKRKESDAIIKISSITRGMIRGTWFSRVFGRVGNFELQKDDKDFMIPPKSARIVESVSGEYKTRWMGKDLRLRLTVRQGTSPQTHNPFAPLTFMGTLEDMYSLEERNWAVGTSTILGGTYDFYTGRMAVQTVDAVGFPTLLVGQMDPSDQKISMKWIIGKTDIPQDEHKLRDFIKLKRGRR